MVKISKNGCQILTKLFGYSAFDEVVRYSFYADFYADKYVPQETAPAGVLDISIGESVYECVLEYKTAKDYAEKYDINIDDAISVFKQLQEVVIQAKDDRGSYETVKAIHIIDEKIGLKQDGERCSVDLAHKKARAEIRLKSVDLLTTKKVQSADTEILLSTKNKITISADASDVESAQEYQKLMKSDGV